MSWLSTTATEFCQLKDQSRSGVCIWKLETRVLPVSGMVSITPGLRGTSKEPSGDLKLVTLLKDALGDQVTLGPKSSDLGVSEMEGSVIVPLPICWVDTRGSMVFRAMIEELVL